MVFKDDYKEESNKSSNTRLEKIINECVVRCLRKYLKEQTNRVLLNETHAVRMWHYTSFDQALSIIRQNKFKLRQNDDVTDETKYKHNGIWYDGYGNVCAAPKYMFCATRIKDSRVGFSSSFQYGFIENGWGFCRIELDENAIEHSPFLTVRTESDCSQHNPHINVYNTKKWKFKNQSDWCTPNWENQHEERILSNKPVIDNAIQYIRRIDFLVKDKEELLSLKKVLKSRRTFADKVFVYSNMGDFNATNENYINLFAINESLNSDDLHYRGVKHYIIA